MVGGKNRTITDCFRRHAGNLFRDPVAEITRKYSPGTNLHLTYNIFVFTLDYGKAVGLTLFRDSCLPDAD